MRFRIKLFEMSYARPEIKRAIDDHVAQIVDNWCLVYIAQRYSKFQDGLKHWAGELAAQLVPGLNKLRASGLSPRGKAKLVDEVLVHDAELDDADVVYDMLEYKFGHEGIDDTSRIVAARAFAADGLPEIRAVLLREVSIVAYERSKTGES